MVTRDQSRGSSSASGHRRSSLTSGRKTLLHPTPSQQLNQKNKLIEKSRANCIKNLQRLIEQRSLNEDSENVHHGKKILNRTTELARMSLHQVKEPKQSKGKPASACLTSKEEQPQTQPTPINKN